MGLKQQLKKLRKSLPPGGRLFVLYEGERVSPSYVDHPGDVCFILTNTWRLAGEVLPEFVEVTPGYQRPVNWQAIEEHEEQQPGRVELPSWVK